MPVTVVNGWHVRQQYTVSDQLVENEFYYVSESPPSQTVMDNLADVQNTWATDVWHNLLPTNCTVTGCEIECLDVSFQVTQPYPLASPVAGAGAAGEPNNVSLSIQRIIPERFRGVHPRLYVPAIRSDKVVSVNLVQTAHGDALVAQLEALRGAALAATDIFTMVALRTTGGGATPSSPRPVIITGHRLRDYTLDSQRRRLPGRGR